MSSAHSPISVLQRTHLYSLFERAFCSQLTRYSEYIEQIVSSILSKLFFVGYDPLDCRVAKERREALIQKCGAIPLQCHNDQGKEIDVVYIPSTLPNRSGNAVVFAETTSYQDRLHHSLPQKYKHFLDCGSDIVLWNPTERKSNQYAQDLLSVLKRVKQRCPHQKIVVKGHCASVEPAIAAASGLNDSSISLILDRGYGDAWELARSFTILTKLPLISRIIQTHFSCGGMEKLRTFPGKIIFIAPMDPTADQIVYWQGKNFTYAMYEHRQCYHFTRDVFIKLGEESDHWSPWNAYEYQQITEELRRIGVVSNRLISSIPGTYPARAQRNSFNKVCLPFLAKAWC